MNYHLNQNGQNLGIFPLEELRRRRNAGELTGRELVWRDGMPQWLPLDSVLHPASPPPLASFSSPVKPKKLHPLVVVGVVAAVVFILIFVGLFGVVVHRALRQIPSSASQPKTTSYTEASSAMAAASRPVECNSNTFTWSDVQKAEREFRVQQYIEGYQQQGMRNPECDLLALQFLTNWISTDFGGPFDTNLPSLAVMGDRLANDPKCQDPLIILATAMNAPELHESVRRLERAVKGFENSKYHGYARFRATVALASKLIQDQPDREPVLDAQSLQNLKAAFTDGSFQPGNQEMLAEILIDEWGTGFFHRNAPAVYKLVQDQGNAYEWLALVLEGRYEIDEAWRVRGDGYANAVSQAGWNGFENHLTSARKCLTRAWKRHPELPMAPCQMITVALGSSGIDEMRDWFDRTTVDQIDFKPAWKEMRWGFRPRWFGDNESMLAFGVTALKTRRFDTDVPRMFFDSLSDLESEMQLRFGQHLYSRSDVWPHLQELYEGYIAQPTISHYDRDGWRSTYSVVASIAGKYDVARTQLQALNWEPHAACLTGWNRDLSLLPQEIAARTGSAAAEVERAETESANGNIDGALNAYKALLGSTKADTQTRAYAQDRVTTLEIEQQIQSGKWVDLLPTDNQFTGWHASFGNFKLLPDHSLEVQSDQNGHLIYSRARMSPNFEVRGQFEVVSTSTTAFQGGLVMGLPEWETYNWYAFRMKRNTDEGDVASFSQHWSRQQILAPAQLVAGTNTFDMRYENGEITATVNGQQVFNKVVPRRKAAINPRECLLGLGAFNDSNSTVIRYRNIQVRKL